MMLGHSFILLALSACPILVSGKPLPLPGNVDYRTASKPETRSIDFGVSLNIDVLGLDFNLTLGGNRMIDLDQARATYKFTKFCDDELTSTEVKRDGETHDVDITNVGVLYTASVGLGTPPTQYKLLIDTGSANTWVGAGQQYTQTSSSVNTGKNVSVGYGSGSFSGLEYTDTLTLSDALVVNEQSIGVANKSTGFNGYDGILGLAPVNVTRMTVVGEDTIPTVSNNLVSQGAISSEIVGVSFAPTTTQPNGNGVMTFGGPAEGQFEGDITYVDITSMSPASKFWGIDMGVTYGDSKTPILSSGSGIVDTGTTLVLLATEAYNAYVNATGAVIDNKVGLLAISEENYSKLSTLYFTVGSTTFEFTPNAQTFPRALNAFVNGDENAIYLVVGNAGRPVGNGLDFILGYSFLERFYSVYDTTNHRVGLATTSNTYVEIN